MEDSLLTKCPHCKTLFRIQHEYLKIADGEVRCGVCYKVFNATTEGISYNEDKTSEPPKEETSREETIEIVQQLDAAETKDHSSENLEPPKSEDIEQLIINDVSVEQLLAAPDTSKRFEKPWLWSSLCVLMLAAFALQWFWFNMSQYSLNPKLRPWYEIACQHLGCRPADFVAINQIQTDRLTIKSHPNYSNVLIVDLIISNQAEFPQPMPALDLAFYDINGVTLSSRKLQPLEYLGKTVEINQMPVNRPIHLSFSIMDPGETAVNYGIKMSKTNP